MIYCLKILINLTKNKNKKIKDFYIFIGIKWLFDHALYTILDFKKKININRNFLDLKASIKEILILT